MQENSFYPEELLFERQENSKKGSVTIPTDLDIIDETLEIMELWGADAIRDCDGTSLPKELLNSGQKIYSTYYTTRKDNAWAKANLDEVQQIYVMSKFHMASSDRLRIKLMEGIHEELLQVNTRDDCKRFWEVIDRTSSEIVPIDLWDYEEESGEVIIQAKPYHDYTVSFLAYIIWDPVHMYNAVINGWQDFEHQITFDVRQPKTKAHSFARLRKYIEDNPEIDVIRFTTFFHQFTLIFDELAREKYVDWYGYSASVSPYVIEQFEKEFNYKFRPEFIIDQGYYNNGYRLHSKEFLDFQNFQMREVAKLAKSFVDICHEYGKEAMMFLGDHWIGTEPFGPYFASIGLDAIVGSVGNASTLRLISDVEGLKYREGRFLPYFFPDSFYEGADPLVEAKNNWVTARRALMRKPLDRIGYGGYLKLALDFPDFVKYIQKVTDEFRLLRSYTEACTPFCFKKVAVLGSKAKLRRWGMFMVHHALYYKQNYSYAGVIDALAGACFDVVFIDFEQVIEDETSLAGIDVVITLGDMDTAYTGGRLWEQGQLKNKSQKFVYNGGGIIGVGQPSAHQHEGRIFQLADVFGVEYENGYTIGYDKYNWETNSHFITEDVRGEIDFGESQANIYAFEGTKVLRQKRSGVELAVNDFGRGRAVYISGLPFSFQNNRILHRAILWASHSEAELKKWYAENPQIDVHAYPENGKYCVVNNTSLKQKSLVFDGQARSFVVELEEGEIKWFKI